jgi:hypothetical protein
MNTLKTLFWPLFGLLLLAVESVIVRQLGFEMTRLDLTMSLLVFLGLRVSLLEGAISAFALGYFFDVLSGRPTWLYPFLALLVFVLARLCRPFVDRRSRWWFASMVGASTLLSGLLALLLTVLTSKFPERRAWTLAGLPAQLVLSSLFAMVVYPLLNRIQPPEGSAPVVLKT